MPTFDPYVYVASLSFSIEVLSDDNAYHSRAVPAVPASEFRRRVVVLSMRSGRARQGTTPGVSMKCIGPDVRQQTAAPNWNLRSMTKLKYLQLGDISEVGEPEDVARSILTPLERWCWWTWIVSSMRCSCASGPDVA